MLGLVGMLKASRSDTTCLQPLHCSETKVANTLVSLPWKLPECRTLLRRARVETERHRRERASAVSGGPAHFGTHVLLVPLRSWEAEP